MQIDDPGEKYPYLIIKEEAGEFRVWKQCRVEVFDAFWATEPISEEEKPRKILFPSQVPDELWNILNQEEKLTSAFAENRYLKARIDRLRFNYRSYLFIAIAVLLPLALAQCAK